MIDRSLAVIIGATIIAATIYATSSGQSRYQIVTSGSIIYRLNVVSGEVSTCQARSLDSSRLHYLVECGEPSEPAR